MPTQAEKASAFRRLHAGEHAFVIPNPWDAGSARLLASLGFPALATTSLGAALTVGKQDGGLGREGILANAAAIVSATDLPVAADLENGFGHDPEAAAETIRLAAEAGLVGGSIEDASGEAGQPIYDIGYATQRVAAAVASARALSFPFTLTARAENFLHGKPDLDDTIKRLQAFEQAGADVLFAPGLPSLEAVRTVCRAVGKPVNIVLAGPLLGLTVSQLSEAGVRRISLGGNLARVAYGAVAKAAREIGNGGPATEIAAARAHMDVVPLMV